MTLNRFVRCMMRLLPNAILDQQHGELIIKTGYKLSDDGARVVEYVRTVCPDCHMPAQMMEHSSVLIGREFAWFICIGCNAMWTQVREEGNHGKSDRHGLAAQPNA